MSNEVYYNDLKLAIYLNGYKTVKEFCEDINVNRTTIYNLLNGKTKRPSGNVVMKLSKAFNISFNDAYELATKR